MQVPNRIDRTRYGITSTSVSSSLFVEPLVMMLMLMLGHCPTAKRHKQLNPLEAKRISDGESYPSWSESCNTRLTYVDS